VSFAYTITPYIHHFIIIPLAPSSAAVRLRLWSSVFGERWALSPKGLSSRLEVTSCQGTISRVRRSVAPETLVTDSCNVFHLIRCHSTAVRCYRFVTVAVAQRWPWDSTLQYVSVFTGRFLRIFSHSIRTIHGTLCIILCTEQHLFYAYYSFTKTYFIINTRHCSFLLK
jgi:hypothetical protein